MTSPALLARLRAAFLEDLEEQLGTMTADLLALEQEPGDAEHLKTLFRAFHTIKGAARAADLPPVERLCHFVEERLAQARDGSRLEEPDFRLLFTAADALHAAGVSLRGAGALSSAVQEELGRLSRGEIAPPPAPTAETAPAATEPPAPPRAEGGDRVRVGTERLDRLFASVGQLQLAQGRLDDRWLSISHALSPRSAAEPANAGALALAVREVEQARRSIGNLLRDLEHQVRDLRMRPFADAVQALPRVVRDVAAETGREVELRLQGEEVQADRAAIEAIREALLHLARNAVDHGIEPPEQRVARGKPRAGTLSVAATLRGEHVEVRVSDDGRGVDTAALRARFAAVDLAAPEDDAALARRLLEGGVSSQASATAISGRGVGLDAARRAIEAVHGSIHMQWEAGRGTTFVLLCPLTLATIRALLVSVGGDRFALPNYSVEAVRRLRADELHHAAGLVFCPTPDGPVPLVPLARVLGVPRSEPSATLLVVLLHTGERRLAVTVDALVTERELTIRPIATAGQALSLVSGGVLLSDGRVVVVLNPGALLDAGLELHPGASLVLPPPSAASPVRRRILVVDDSITTRTLEKSTLEAAGYEVVTAVDGVQGWQTLQESGADLVVTDVEMPNMDGLELCSTIRASARFREIPVILVTSLDSPEHRARGMEAGADAYVGKAAFDQHALLSLVEQLLASGVDP